jgi:hypothetical protein
MLPNIVGNEQNNAMRGRSQARSILLTFLYLFSFRKNAPSYSLLRRHIKDRDPGKEPPDSGQYAIKYYDYSNSFSIKARQFSPDSFWCWKICPD